MAFGDLTTIDNVLAWLSPPPTPLDIPLLERLISAASDFIHKTLSAFIPLADYSEIRDGTGGRTMIFANQPVVRVRSVAVGTVTVPVSNDRVAAGYLFTPTSLALRGGFIFPRGLQNVQLDYTAGYVVIPQAIEQACIELITLRYRERSREGVIQENIVGISSTTFRVIDLAPSTASALLRYQQVAPVSPFGRSPAPPSEIVI